MSGSIALQGSSFSRPTINQSTVDHIRDVSTSRNSAVSVMDRIKDWFCGTKHVEAKQILYDMLHTRDPAEKVDKFLKLKELCTEPYKDNFKVVVGDPGSIVLTLQEGYKSPIIQMFPLNSWKQCNNYKEVAIQLGRTGRDNSENLECPDVMNAICLPVDQLPAGKVISSKLKASEAITQHEGYKPSTQRVHKNTYEVTIARGLESKDNEELDDIDTNDSSCERYNVDIFINQNDCIFVGKVEKIHVHSHTPVREPMHSAGYCSSYR